MSSDGAAEPAGRVLLVGLGPTTADAFAALHPRFSVVGLIRADQDEVSQQASEAGVDVVADTTLATLDRLISERQPDCVVVSSYHRILPAAVLDRSRFVNVHYAPLPEYRGRATVNWVIINGERETAITIHTMVPGLDAGRILRQEKVTIEPTDTVTDLYRKLNARQRVLLGDAVDDCLAGVPGADQDDAAATYACTRVPRDGEIDWSLPTQAIDRLVRALTDPYPGAFTYLGTRRLWVRRAAPVADSPRYVGRIPGRVVRVAAADGFVDVLTGDGVYRLYEVCPDDAETAVPASAVIRSVKDTLGLGVAALLERLAALESELTELRGAQLAPDR
ncbi:MAG: methionyl-tRNA formyltransferase [Actinomycetes bacterium]